jgi:hypothetical protein
MLGVISSMSTEKLHESLRAELAVAWRKLRGNHPSDDFYAFGIRTHDIGSPVSVIACTEQGLNRVAGEYAARHGTDKRLHLASLRWRLADSPLLEEGFELAPETQALRDADPDPYGGSPEAEVAIEGFFSAAFAALQDLDRAGTFGEGCAREKLVLSVWLYDQSDEEILDAARRLNSAAIVRRYSEELELGHEAFLAWSQNKSDSE